MATTIGFIGSGNLGSTVARLLVGARHNVVMSNSRGPETLGDLVEGLGPLASAATGSKAAGAGAFVVVSIPLKTYRDIPVEELSGKIILDTMNYYPWRDGRIKELDDESTTTSELLQALLPESPVVKAFNTIFFRHLAELPRPHGAADRSALPIAGNSSDAKALVQELLDEIGFDTVDLGPLAEGWRIQRDTPPYVSPYAAYPLGEDGEDLPAAMKRLERGATPADASTIERLASAANRYRDL